MHVMAGEPNLRFSEDMDMFSGSESGHGTHTIDPFREETVSEYIHVCVCVCVCACIYIHTHVGYDMDMFSVSESGPGTSQIVDFNKLCLSVCLSVCLSKHIRSILSENRL